MCFGSSDSAGELGGLELIVNLVLGFRPSLDLFAEVENGECDLGGWVRRERGCRKGGEKVDWSPPSFLS
jgi:hypothetical protein